MKQTKSFFKTEALATMLFNLALPVTGLLLILALICWRWLAR
jgi:hypothetical protein